MEVFNQTDTRSENRKWIEQAFELNSVLKP